MDLLKIARVPAITVGPETTVYQAALKMAENRVGAVVVVNDENKVIGIFTERDHLYRVTCQELNPKKTTMIEVMTSAVVTVPSDISINDGLALMVRERFRHLPIVDPHNRSVGLASIRHLLMRRLHEKQDSIETLAAYAEAGGPG